MVYEFLREYVRPVGYVIATGALAFGLAFGADYAEAKPRPPLRRVGDSIQLTYRGSNGTQVNRNLTQDVRRITKPIERAIVRHQQTNKRR